MPLIYRFTNKILERPKTEGSGTVVLFKNPRRRIEMKKTMILLTKSRKNKGYCTAGIDLESGEWIRIVSDEIECISNEMLDRHLRYSNGSEAQILDKIEIECKGYELNYHQPENYVFDSSINIHKIGNGSLDKVLKIHPFENKNFIFYDTGYSIHCDRINSIKPGDRYSLILIKVTDPQVDVKTWGNESRTVTLNFIYNFRTYRYFRITDGFENKYKREKPDGIYTLPGDYALVISLGDLYKDNKHYKLVSKMFPLL